jgi:hypothetical protein
MASDLQLPESRHCARITSPGFRVRVVFSVKSNGQSFAVLAIGAPMDGMQPGTAAIRFGVSRLIHGLQD